MGLSGTILRRRPLIAGFDGVTKWTSALGRRVSFFVIAGKTTDEIYEGYRLLTGATPMLPKAAYGFIQCKQRYSSQAEVLGVANGYRERHLPLDILVVDWFYYTRMGEYDFDPAQWPDPAAMNRELHARNIESMISVWPRFAPGSRYYDGLLAKGWFEKYADGKPVDGLPYDKAGSDIDTTNPDAARWFWNLIRDNIASKGFDYFWADETEPDLPPDGAYLSIGPGAQYLNVYPLLHTAAIYDGVRRDESKRALILSSRCVSGSAEERHDLLVVGYLADVGYAAPANPDGAEHGGVGHRIYRQRHRRMAVAPRAAYTRASAAHRPFRRSRQRRTRR